MAGDSLTRTTLPVGPALSCQNITKAYGGVPALRNFEIVIHPGEIHALVGENGCGKSTLIKALSGYHSPEPGGTIVIGGEPLRRASPDAAYALGARFVQQDLGLVDSCSVLDNLLLNSGFPTRMFTIRDRRALHGARADLTRVGLDIDPRASVGSLSPAEKTELAIARALHSDPHHPVALLVLDEPTATLPSDEVQRLLATLRRVASSGCAVLYVTHRLDEVLQVADNVTVLRDGRKVAARPVAHLTRGELVQMIVGHEFDETRKLAAGTSLKAGEPILRIRELAAGHIESLSLDVHPGDVLGIAGITGSGREALLPAIFAGTSLRTGMIEVDGRPHRKPRPGRSVRAGMAYLPPDRKQLSALLELTARENMTLADLRPFSRGPLLRARPERAETRRWFDLLDVRPADGAEQRLGSFSGGNQQKVLLAKWLRCAPRVLLLDEPTQGVDIGAKGELYRHILRAARDGAAVIVASTEAEELEVLCNRVLVLRSGKGFEIDPSSLTAATISRECLGPQGAAA